MNARTFTTCDYQMTINQRERLKRIDDLRAALARRDPPPLTLAEKLSIVCIIAGVVAFVVAMMTVNWFGGL